MAMQYRMCELMLDIREIRKEQAQEPKVFRKKATKPSKKVTEESMTDYRAFKHLLEQRETANKYNPSTLRTWLRTLKNGKTPKAVEKILRFAGYTIATERKWNKPRNRRK